MPNTSERHALVLVTVLACLGVVARVSRATRTRPRPTSTELRALDNQIARVESARAAKRAGSARSNARAGGARERSRANRTSAQRGSESVEARPSATRDARPIVIDLDMASATEIERLPYVGRVLAARIVANRDSCGTFGSIDGLKRVFGIGDGMGRRLAPLVTFSGASSPLGTAQQASCPSADNRAALRRRGRPH